MAITEERTQVEETRETSEPPPSLPPEANRGWSPMWLLILVGVVAAVMVAVLAFRPDSEVDTPNHQQVIEQGSPTAVDHAAEVVVPSHQQVIENGSPTAVDHAAADLDVSGQLADWARTNGVSGLSPASVSAGGTSPAGDSSDGEFLPGSRHVPTS